MVKNNMKIIGGKRNFEFNQSSFIAITIFCDKCGSSKLREAYEMNSDEGLFFCCEKCNNEFFVREIIIKKETK